MLDEEDDECDILSDEEEYSIEEQHDDQECFCSDNADKGFNDSAYDDNEVDNHLMHHNPSYSSGDGIDEADEVD